MLRNKDIKKIQELKADFTPSQGQICFQKSNKYIIFEL